jgi:hypothetical protein
MYSDIPTINSSLKFKKLILFKFNRFKILAKIRDNSTKSRNCKRIIFSNQKLRSYQVETTSLTPVKVPKISWELEK